MKESKFKSYSQVGQDKFVYKLLGRNFKGRFLDIGCCHPIEINNTYALESLGWDGLSVDSADVGELFSKHRKTKFVRCDARNIVFNPGESFDYGSFDVDGDTYDALSNALQQGVKFRILTVEHNQYLGWFQVRDRLRGLLTSYGYTMVCENVCDGEFPFEDWWVDMKTVDTSKVKSFVCICKDGKEITKDSNFVSYFDKVFVINLDRRTDRWDHAVTELEKVGLTAERFSGYDNVIWDGRVNGNVGCTASHRAILELIAYHKWPRTLVLEDDFVAIREDVPEMFAKMVIELPEDWDLVYLGAHYAEKPKSRHSEHVIRAGRIFTTSSYMITAKQARKMAPYISGIGPIDVLFGSFSDNSNVFVFQPRLFAQYENYSDLCERVMNNRPCMEDCNHENLV